ncbi:hypothetical protein QAD02_005118 [Eretmocerus hayati]|uniref:Uncharacterized protein n=1 Tax=Eretmocerus hayati TaxID=131215 RepID=A0ACC2NTE3_9HYME|nr:hypothetical protein QAD02_005118 [Eretmocerus hayati]
MMRKNAKSLTPLHLADLVRDEAIIDILLEAQMFELGNPEDSSGLSHFHIACTRNDRKVVEFFLKQGVDVNFDVCDRSSTNWYKWKDYEPLMLAIHYECPDVVEILLRYGANLTNQYNLDDEGHLRLAYETGNQRVIDLLLNSKAIKNKKVPSGEEFSDFQLACISKDVKKIDSLLNCAKTEAPDLNTPLWYGCTPLHYLVRSFPKEAMSFFQYFPCNISAKDSRGKTPLHIFFDYCFHETGKSLPSPLLDFERNPSDLDGLTHLHIACTTNQLDSIERFLKNGANVDCAVGSNSPKWAGYTPLHFAVKYRQTQIVDLLLKNGAKVSAKNGIGLTPFDMAILSLNSDDFHQKPIWVMLWKMLLEDEISDNEFDKRGFSLLHVICSTKIELNPDEFSHYIDILPGGIDQAIDYPASKYHKYTALHFAGKNSNNNIAKWLIEKGANIYLKNCDGYSLFQYELDESGIYGILGKNPGLLRLSGNPFDLKGLSYFHHGCVLGDRETIEYYLRLGVDINLRTRMGIKGHNVGKTPLHWVLWRKYDNSKDTVTFLLDNGADVMARDAYQNTPLHSIISYNFDKEVAQLLIDRGADVNAQNFLGETPLYKACRKLEYSILVSFLIENGADINVENDRADTPLTHICELLINVGYGHDKLIVKLLKHVKKLMLIGMHVSTKNQSMYFRMLDLYSFGGFRERDIEKKCLEEIQLMKYTKINQYTTLHDIVYETANNMAHLIRNSSLRKMIRSNDFPANFPLYGYLIRLQVRRGLRRIPLLEGCKKFFHSLANLSVESAERISDYLDDFDLKNIIASGRTFS